MAALSFKCGYIIQYALKLQKYKKYSNASVYNIQSETCFIILFYYLNK